MKYVPIVSSNLSSIAYDENGAVLGVRFHASGEYRYFGVPRAIYDGFFTAPSAGRYFDQYVKKGGYAYSRVG